ncbi:MAG: hypothetical protein IJV96_03170 [Clostridia bacterium]|nr:hypothetical protein [Clostridia bacterium]
MTKSQKKLAEKNGTLDALYAARVHALVRERYSLSEELSLLRRREEKPENFGTYYDFVEACKKAARAEIYGEEMSE